MAARSSDDDAGRKLLNLIEGMPAETKQHLRALLEQLDSQSNAGVHIVADRPIESSFTPSVDTTTTTSAAVPGPDTKVAGVFKNSYHFIIANRYDITDAEDSRGGPNAAGEKRKRAPAP